MHCLLLFASGNIKKIRHVLLCVAIMGIIVVVLASVIIILSIRMTTVLSEEMRENISLTKQNLQLRKENEDLQRWTEELIRERVGLNWTIRVILEYDSFPVHSHCPNTVCRPCMDGWIQFQSKCYLFCKSSNSSKWRTWQESRDFCRQKQAELVVIESPEEQEFISNHIEYYFDEYHGFWIGLSNTNQMNTWMWVDGSDVTLSYWTAHRGYSTSCVLSIPKADPLANWNKVSCSMVNLFICETTALIKPD
ncbi:low affinity immunoglobulin epsilon Fc receptor-like [Solea solea]|uniref:low affinity immunoglobulin epsilon Fc receptor-like n=1 Tax=Solea solea TaxID=90069 RepID=UPI00272CD66D|nr:low affinity immunoglobulin epsilon Fc receptor-like [Solea solea]